MPAHAETLRNLCNRISSLRDLAHRDTLKLFAENRFARDALLASKLGKKAPTNLEAIHVIPNIADKRCTIRLGVASPQPWHYWSQKRV